MTEQEAIEKLKTDNCVECGYSDNATTCDYGACGVAIATRMAIKALEEIQQYRAIGTVEDCRAAVEKQKKIRNKAIDDFAELLKGNLIRKYAKANITQQYVALQVTDWCNEIAEQLKGGGANA